MNQTTPITKGKVRILLAIGNFTGSTLILTIAGYEGILCGFTAIYAAMAQVINESYGEELLPLGNIN